LEFPTFAAAVPLWLVGDDLRSWLDFLLPLDDFPLVDLGGVVVTVSLLLLVVAADLVVLDDMDMPSMPLSKSSALPVMILMIIYLFRMMFVEL